MAKTKQVYQGGSAMNSMSPMKLISLIAGGVAVVVMLFVVFTMFGTNRLGYYQVKQSAGTGTIAVINDPGMFGRWGGDVFSYQVSDILYFSKHDIDGGSGEKAQPIKVQFIDGSYADVSGALKFRLSTTPKQQVLLHQDYKSFNAVVQDLVRQVVGEALIQTATLMKAEEFYSSRRAEYTALAEEQIQNGIYATVSQEAKYKDAEGNEFVERTSVIKTDNDGNKVVRKESPFKRYGIEVVSFVIKDIDFDPTINALIAKKKEAEQMKVVARANAEKAKQDAITATEQGKAQIETARAAELVEKIKATTIAQKEYEVSVLQHKEAAENAAAEILKGEAEAKISKQKVAAGLTPLERATIQKETAIGIAEALAKVNLPSTMVIGGGGGAHGGSLDPFQAIGLKSMLDITRDIEKRTTKVDAPVAQEEESK
jgi:regulator of protease activity HflC (stomatin/prohibitin superfamily)